MPPSYISIIHVSISSLSLNISITMPCLCRPSKRRFLTPKAGNRKSSWIERAFRALRCVPNIHLHLQYWHILLLDSKKQRKKHGKRPKISLVRQDSSDLFTFVRPSPLFDPFDQQLPSTPISFSPDSFFQIPAQGPSQDHLIARSNSSPQDRNLHFEPSPNPLLPLRVRFQDTSSGPQYVFELYIVSVLGY